MMRVRSHFVPVEQLVVGQDTVSGIVESISLIGNSSVNLYVTIWSSAVPHRVYNLPVGYGVQVYDVA